MIHRITNPVAMDLINYASEIMLLPGGSGAIELPQYSISPSRNRITNFRIIEANEGIVGAILR